MSTAQTQEVGDLSKAELNDLEDQVSLPYTIENVTLMSPGTWNDIKWTGQEIRKGMNRTDFDEDHNNALFLDHEDRDSEQWIGRVVNVQMDGDDMVGDIEIVDKDTAIKLEFGAKFGISPKVTGRSDGRKMKEFEFDNFSVVVNPAVKTTFLNSELIQHVGKEKEGESVKAVAMSQDEEEMAKHGKDEEMAEMQTHKPEFSETADQEWNSPDMEDFDTDDLSEIDNHFIVSKSGFPPENFTDLALPVVEPDGTLNLNALQNAKARAGQVEGMSEDMVEEVKNMIDSMANENFDADFGDEMNAPNGSENSQHREGEMGAHEEMNENDTTDQNQNQDNTGDSTMSDEEQTGEAEPEAETSDQEVEVDEEALAQKVAEILEEDDEEDPEAEEEEEEEVENEEASVDADVSEFSEFVSSKMEENPEMSYVEAAKEFNEAQKSEAQKVREEVKEEMSEQMDSLKEEIQELKEEETEAQRASQTLGQEEVKEAQEEVAELSDDELHKDIMKSWMSNIHGYRGDQ